MSGDFGISEVFPKESEEYRILDEAYGILVSGNPQISAEYKTKLLLLDKSRAELSSLYFMVSRNINKLKNETQNDYDSQYTRLVKLGRPSNTAIEAEIRLLNPNYVKIITKIEELDNMRNLISNYIRSIDSCKNTTVELLRDSRRID